MIWMFVTAELAKLRVLELRQSAPDRRERPREPAAGADAAPKPPAPASSTKRRAA